MLTQKAILRVKKNFNQKHNRAVKRIGLEPSKSRGTTPHAHRHSYGYRLSQGGFSQLEIQKAMHHKSPDSCLVYLTPSDDEVRQQMRGAH
ncbi:site-specific integrase [Vibrio sp. B1FIG11]|uniref:tyrosine-type recombinase/integrase n=1 Tax=Vibrio sp. B1FIG11 TaxID=2751177 RepID=UPI001FD5CD25|nr:site-specific integrase [Vibrio sp. B1FIG11]